MLERVKDVVLIYPDEVLSVVEDFYVPMGEEEEYDEILDPEEDEDYEPLVEFPVETPDQFQLRAYEPLSVLYFLRKALGEDWWKHEVGAICDFVEPWYRVSSATRDRIYALRVLYTTDFFWLDWEVFNVVCQGLRGLGVDFENVPELSAPRLVAPLMTADVIVRLQDCTANYSPEVSSYIAANCLESGHWALPFPLSVVQGRVKELCGHRGLHLPIAEVLELAESGKEPGSKGEANIQARKYLFLRDYYRYKIAKLRKEIGIIARKL